MIKKLSFVIVLSLILSTFNGCKEDKTNKEAYKIKDMSKTPEKLNVRQEDLYISDMMKDKDLLFKIIVSYKPNDINSNVTAFFYKDTETTNYRVDIVETEYKDKKEKPNVKTTTVYIKPNLYEFIVAAYNRDVLTASDWSIIFTNLELGSNSLVYENLYLSGKWENANKTFSNQIYSCEDREKGCLIFYGKLNNETLEGYKIDYLYFNGVAPVVETKASGFYNENRDKEIRNFISLANMNDKAEYNQILLHKIINEGLDAGLDYIRNIKF